MSDEFEPKLVNYLKAIEGKPHGQVIFDHHQLMRMHFGPGVYAILDGDEIEIYYDPEQWDIIEQLKGRLEKIPEAKGLGLIAPTMPGNFCGAYQTAKRSLKAKSGAELLKEPEIIFLHPELKNILFLMDVHEIYGVNLDTYPK